jgi:uncharacterized protein YbjT (DUF2867 family)
MRLLVTGATGYIGGRLVPRLLEAGHEVRVLVRDAQRIVGRPWADRVRVIEADVLDADTLGPAAVLGIDAAYYLIHSMSGGRGFAEADRLAATHFAEACAAAGVNHVIYLGGLLPEGEKVSEHLKSRAQTGEVLREELPGRVTEFRAGPIIGSGSASFEMVRYLTERLPAMVAPRWVNNTVQPIAIRDVLSYLERVLPLGPCGVVEIGADVLTFKQMMQGYAAARGLKRWIIPVPVLAPRLAARWVGLVTPISNRLAVPLVSGVIRPLTGDPRKARERFPEIETIDYDTSVRQALERTEAGRVETRWSGALGVRTPPDGQPTSRDWEGVVTERRRIAVRATPRQTFDAFTSLGGQTGWLVWGWAWRLRGVLDKLVGGPGLRRGRRHPTELLPGEALDFWRVEAVDPDRGMLLLRAEMKVPGRAWLRFDASADQDDPNHCYLDQIAFFEPHGLPGFLYWYGLYPLHRLIFTDMARAVAKRAEGRA